jgi:SpoVK/Ycf46/Vps4 family AAA+-type ATPase
MLAQALAQRLSIRLSSVYVRTRFLEIDSHALLSKFFGESSKQVGRLFESILEIAKDDSELVVVLFDEVETIAGSREKARQAAEVADAIRVSVWCRVNDISLTSQVYKRDAQRPRQNSQAQ